VIVAVQRATPIAWLQSRLLGFRVPMRPAFVCLCVLYLTARAALDNTYRSGTSDYALSERASSLSHGIVRYTSTATWSGLACSVWSHGTGRHTAVQASTLSCHYCHFLYSLCVKPLARQPLARRSTASVL
jgi:hypothetical protein